MHIILEMFNNNNNNNKETKSRVNQLDVRNKLDHHKKWYEPYNQN